MQLKWLPKVDEIISKKKTGVGKVAATTKEKSLYLEYKITTIDSECVSLHEQCERVCYIFSDGDSVSVGRK